MQFRLFSKVDSNDLVIRYELTISSTTCIIKTKTQSTLYQRVLFDLSLWFVLFYIIASLKVIVSRPKFCIHRSIFILRYLILKTKSLYTFSSGTRT